jgi:hypothetical protein
MKLLLTLFSSFFLSATIAQTVQSDTVVLNAIEQQGNTMGKLLLSKDYKTFIKYTHPVIMDMAGGEENMIEIIKAGMEQVENQNISISFCSVERPVSYISFKNELQCTVVQRMEMKFPEGRVLSKSFLVAVSDDKGKNWKFIDPNGRDLKELQKILPDLSDTLIIPKDEEPVIIKD